MLCSSECDLAKADDAGECVRSRPSGRAVQSTPVALAAAVVEGIENADASWWLGGRLVVAHVGELVPLPLEREVASRRRRVLPADVLGAVSPADPCQGDRSDRDAQRRG